MRVERILLPLALVNVAVLIYEILFNVLSALRSSF